MGSQGLSGACQPHSKRILPGWTQRSWEPPRGDPWEMGVISHGGLLLVILPSPAHLHLPALCSSGPRLRLPIVPGSSGRLSFWRTPQKGQEPTSIGLQKGMRPRRTRAHSCCKEGICTTDPIFQLRSPWTGLLAGGSQDGGFHSSLPSSIRFPDLSSSLTEKNQPQGKAALWNLSLETFKDGDQNI